MINQENAMMVVDDGEIASNFLPLIPPFVRFNQFAFENEVLLEEIFSYINAPISFIALQKTNKQFHSNQILQRAIMSTFRRNLTHLVTSSGYAELAKQTDPESGYMSVLKPRKCVLSGSIVLQAVLGEVWVGSDIDMYTVASDTLRVRHKLYRKMGFLSPVRPCGTERHTDETVWMSIYLIAVAGSVLQSVELWTSPEPKAEEVETAANALNTARFHGDNPLLKFHRSSRSAGMLQMMVLKDEFATAQVAIDKFDLDIVKNSWDGVTLEIHDYISIVSKVAHGSDYVQAMASAFGNTTDPTSDKYFRLQELEETGLIKIGGMDGWGSRGGRVSYKKGIKSIFNVLFGRLFKYSKRGFTIMLKGKEWTRGKLTGITEWIEDDDGNDTDGDSDLANGIY